MVQDIQGQNRTYRGKTQPPRTVLDGQDRTGYTGTVQDNLGQYMTDAQNSTYSDRKGKTTTVQDNLRNPRAS